VLSAALVRAGQASSCLGAFRQIQAFRPKAKLNGAQRASLLEWARAFGEQWDDDAEPAVAPVAPAEPEQQNAEKGAATGEGGDEVELNEDKYAVLDDPKPEKSDKAPPPPPRDQSIGPPV